jgi:hypothetical protein
MSKFFDSETVGKIDDMLQGNQPEAPEQEDQLAEDVIKSEADEDVKQETEASDVQEEVGESDTTELEPTDEPQQELSGLNDDGDVKEGSHRVPYNRFKQVIEARNQLRSERDQLTSQVSELSKQMQQFQQAPRQEQAEPRETQITHGEANMPDFLTEEEQEYFTGLQQNFNTKYGALEQRLNTYEVQMASTRLEEQIQEAEAKYPDVPRRAILEAVVSDGTANVMDVAERYQTFVNQLREQAVAEYLGTNPGQKAAPKVAPRPKKTSGSMDRPPGEEGKRHTNLKDANKALLKFLETNSIF